jgi:hypothetical protein
MSPSRKIDDAVKTFSPPGELDLDLDEGGSLSLSLTEAGPVGVAFARLTFTAADRSERAPEALQAWADRLSARVTYLMEPLIVVEHDREAGAVAVRSQAPTVRNDRRTYYEVRLARHGTLTMTRMAYDESTRRRAPIPCQMTLEALERLADDLAACAG